MSRHQAHAFDTLTQFCRRCGMPRTEMAEAPQLQIECDGEWERRKAEDEPRRATLREAAERLFAEADLAAEVQAREDAQTFTWGQIRRAFKIPPGVI
jgi:hypothetical protein